MSPIRMAIYLSVIGAMILPSYVNNQGIFYDLHRHIFFQIGPDRVEARNNLGAIGRAQQAYHLENNHFADSIAATGLEINIETSKYSYRIVQPMMPVQDLNHSDIYDKQPSMIIAIAYKNIKGNTRPSPADIDLKNYLGVVYTLPQTSASGETEIITRAGLCEMTRENPLPTTMPKLINGAIQCPNGANKLGE